MALKLTENAIVAATYIGVEPSIVLEIDGVQTRFSVGLLKRYIKIGDDALFIGDDWRIGGYKLLEDQSDLISLDGSTTTITQQLLQDKGGTSSVTSIEIGLIDDNNEATMLISPSFTVEELLGRKSKVYLGFQNTAFPQDYVLIFSGTIDSIASSGIITINIANPEQKKRQTLFQQMSVELTSDITSSQTTIPVTSTSGFLLQDSPTIQTYVRIDDEVIKYTSFDGYNFTGCSRGQVGTSAVAHSVETPVNSIYRFYGNAFDLALKLQLSNEGNTYFLENLKVTSFVRVSPIETKKNAIFFQDVDVKEKYGVVAGDLITTTGALKPENNVTLKQIYQIGYNEYGSYIIINGVNFLEEGDTPAVMSIKSKYNTLQYVGLGMGGDEVDVPEYERIKGYFSSQIPTLDFYLKDTIDGKSFIDGELLYPCGAFSLPRKGRASIGFTMPPLAVENLTYINEDNVVNPSKLKVKRSTAKNFYNTIVYKFNEDVIEDRFLSGYVTIDEDSKNRIKVGGKQMLIESKGFRPSTDQKRIMRINSFRFLDRYKFAAETFELEIFYGTGFNLDVGDIVLFGDSALQIADITKGTREFEPRLCEITNKRMDIKTGAVSLTLTDTNFDTTGRYGIISPSSIVGIGSTISKISIVDSYAQDIGYIERDKWDNYIGSTIYIHNVDYSVGFTTRLLGFEEGNDYMMIVSNMPQVPTQNMIVDIPSYDDAENVYKRIHCYVSPESEITSVISTTEYAVTNIDKFFVGCYVVFHSDDYSVHEEKIEVTNIVGNNITLKKAPTNTILVGYNVKNIGFKSDLGHSYLYL